MAHISDINTFAHIGQRPVESAQHEGSWQWTQEGVMATAHDQATGVTLFHDSTCHLTYICQEDSYEHRVTSPISLYFHAWFGREFTFAVMDVIAHDENYSVRIDTRW